MNHKARTPYYADDADYPPRRADHAPDDAGLWFMLLVLILGSLFLAVVTDYPDVASGPQAEMAIGSNAD